MSAPACPPQSARAPEGTAPEGTTAGTATPGPTGPEPAGAPGRRGAAGPDPAPEAGAGLELDAVAREHLPALVRYATTLTGDREVAADIVQEVLVRAHSRWRRIGLLERPDLYLRRMVTNEHVSWRRRWHVRTVRATSDEVLAARAAPTADHAQGIVENDALHRALGRLSPRQRSVLVLRYYEGLDDAEIAAVIGTSRATVRSHVSHALAALRAATDASPGLL